MNNYENAEEMQAAAIKVAPINNFHGIINNFNKENATIITDLFDFETLDYYARKNCELPISEEEKAKYETEYRGGLQGDYSSEMALKVTNVVECLNKFLGANINFETGPRRVGDSECIVANPEKFIRTMSWKPEFDDLNYILKTAIAWEKKLN